MMTTPARSLVRRVSPHEAHEEERDVRLRDRIPRRLFRVERAADGVLGEILGLRLRLRQRQREREHLLVHLRPCDGAEGGVDGGPRGGGDGVGRSGHGREG